MRVKVEGGVMSYQVWGGWKEIRCMCGKPAVGVLITRGGKIFLWKNIDGYIDVPALVPFARCEEHGRDNKD